MTEVPSRPEVRNAPLHLRDVNRLRDVVELIAVGAGQVAAPHGHDVRHVRVRSVRHSRCDGSELAQFARSRDQPPPRRHAASRRGCTRLVGVGRSSLRDLCCGRHANLDSIASGLLLQVKMRDFERPLHLSAPRVLRWCHVRF